MFRGYKEAGLKKECIKKKIRNLGISMVLFLLPLVSCAQNITAKLPSIFDRSYLNYKTSVQPIDLSLGARCPGTKVLHVVSKELRMEPYTVYSVSGTIYRLIPAEYTRIVSQYMEDKLRESNVKIDEQTGREIDVWMEEVHADGFWAFGCNVKLKINIQEIGYTKVYAGYEGGEFIDNVIGYATNLALVEFIKDPVVQKYIQCTEENAAK